MRQRPWRALRSKSLRGRALGEEKAMPANDAIARMLKRGNEDEP